MIKKQIKYILTCDGCGKEIIHETKIGKLHEDIEISQPNLLQELRLRYVNGSYDYLEFWGCTQKCLEKVVDEFYNKKKKTVLKNLNNK